MSRAGHVPGSPTLVVVLLAAGVQAPLAARQAPAPVGPATASAEVSDLAWSPDGRRIAFVVIRPGDAVGARWSEVWLADAGGADPVAPLTDGLDHARAPAFSPDGRYISVLARGPGDPVPQLHLEPLAGGPTRRLTASGAGVEGYAWTPGGGAVVFTARGPAEADGGAQLWVADVEAGTVRPLTTGAIHAGAPTVSPDGLWVAHERALIGRDGAPYEPDVWLIPISGGDARRLTIDAGPDRDPRWSPDGRRIAYRAAPNGEGERLRLVPLDGRPPADLTDPSRPGPGPPAWTRDGHLIYVGGGGRGVLSIPADPVLRGRGVRTVVAGDAGVGAIALSPDGGRLAYVLGAADGPPDVYVVPLDGAPAGARRITDLRSALGRRPVAEGRPSPGSGASTVPACAGVPNPE